MLLNSGASSWPLAFSLALKKPMSNRCFLREDPCLSHCPLEISQGSLGQQADWTTIKSSALKNICNIEVKRGFAAPENQRTRVLTSVEALPSQLKRLLKLQFTTSRASQLNYIGLL